jgi:hypothetical protein
MPFPSGCGFERTGLPGARLGRADADPLPRARDARPGRGRRRPGDESSHRAPADPGHRQALSVHDPRRSLAGQLRPGVHLGAPASTGPDGRSGFLRTPAGPHAVEQECRLALLPHHLRGGGVPDDSRRTKPPPPSGAKVPGSSTTRRRSSPRTATHRGRDERGSTPGPSATRIPASRSGWVCRPPCHPGSSPRRAGGGTDERPVEDAVLRSPLAGGEEEDRGGGEGGPAHDATVSQPGGRWVKLPGSSQRFRAWPRRRPAG